MKMKLLLLPLILMLVSPVAFCWEKVNQLNVIYGTKITQAKPDILTPFAELVYDANEDEFGISFLKTNGERTTVNYGLYSIHACNQESKGVIVGSMLQDAKDSSRMNILFQDCKRPMFLRIWNLDNDYVTYKFENIGPI